MVFRPSIWNDLERKVPASQARKILSFGREIEGYGPENREAKSGAENRAGLKPKTRPNKATAPKDLSQRPEETPTLLRFAP
jgi:hypothetical protein